MLRPFFDLSFVSFCVGGGRESKKVLFLGGESRRRSQGLKKCKISLRVRLFFFECVFKFHEIDKRESRC